MAFSLRILLFCIIQINLINIYTISVNDTLLYRMKKIYKKLIGNNLYYNNPFITSNLRFLEEEEQKNKSKEESGIGWLSDKFLNLIREEMGPFINNSKVNKNVSETCREILYKSIINNNPNISEYHIKKIIQGATKHTNDLSTYDICMFKTFELTNESNINDFGKNIFFIITLDNSNRKLNENDGEYAFSKKNAEIDSLFYIRGFCFPQDQINNQDACSDSDYFNFLMNFNKYMGNVLMLDNKEYTYFILESENYGGGIYFLRLLPLFYAVIQILLIMFRDIIMLIPKNCYQKKSDEKINRLINDIGEEQNYLMEKEEEEEEKYNIIKKKKYFKK